MEAKINSKRQENFGYISKDGWNEKREELSKKEDQKYENLAPLCPQLNDNFNKSSKKCQERGTGKDWVNNNTRSVDEWVKKHEEHQESINRQVSESCTFIPKLDPALDVKL